MTRILYNRGLLCGIVKVPAESERDMATYLGSYAEDDPIYTRQFQVWVPNGGRHLKPSDLQGNKPEDAAAPSNDAQAQEAPGRSWALDALFAIHEARERLIQELVDQGIDRDEIESYL